jgi:hypothetical protein
MVVPLVEFLSVRNYPTRNEGTSKMTYCFEQVEYKAKDGTILLLDGCADCATYYQKAEPQTHDDPGCPAEVLVESIDSVSIEAVALMVDEDVVGLMSIGEIESPFLKTLEAFIEKDQLEEAQAYALTEDARDYVPEPYDC